jgi:hypothetical protein
MDTSPTNIDMLTKAVEIQKLYNPNKFSVLWDYNLKYDYDHNMKYKEYRIYPDYSKDRPYLHPTHVFETCDGYEWMAIWVPQQDDLQDIYYTKEIAERYQTTKGVHLALQLSWFVTNYRSYSEQFVSPEQLWLAFVMKKNFDRTWNSDKKDWIK